MNVKTHAACQIIRKYTHKEKNTPRRKNNEMLYILYLLSQPPPVLAWFSVFFYGKPVMHTRGMAEIAAYKRELLLHPQQSKCKLYDLPDKVQIVSTPVDMWWEDRIPHIMQT